MSRHVDRELARVRLQAAHRVEDRSCELAPLVRSLIATLARTPEGMRVAFEPRLAEGIRLPFGRADLAEVLGNLLENAARHAASRVRITAEAGTGGPALAVEDDGEGVARGSRPGVSGRATWMDQRGHGTGLGLTIVQDVLEAYGWRLELGRSDLGGLRAVIRPDRAVEAPRLTTWRPPFPLLWRRGSTNRLGDGGDRPRTGM